MKKQSIAKKIENYLLRHPQITFKSENESGSKYFQCYSTLIRLSNHVTYRISMPEVLNIIVNDDTFALIFGNQLINLNDYDEFKNFLKYFIIIQDTMQKALLVEYDKITAAENATCKGRNVVNYINFRNRLYNVSELTNKQIAQIDDKINRKLITNEDALIKQIEEFKTQLVAYI